MFKLLVILYIIKLYAQIDIYVQNFYQQDEQIVFLVYFFPV